MKIGYARVSTNDQTLEPQKDALSEAGCEKLFTDVASGARTQRPGLDEAIAFCRHGDTLVVWKLDRKMWRPDPYFSTSRKRFSRLTLVKNNYFVPF
jgi:DNA invertase Pin-like site-specific DNA recombinase